MRRMIISAVMLLSIFAVVACGSNSDISQDQESIEYSSDVQGQKTETEELHNFCPVLSEYLSAEVVEVAEAFVKVRISNIGSLWINFGERYVLEFLSDGYWVYIPKLQPVTDEGLVVPPHDSYEIRHSIPSNHQDLESGLYRLRMQFWASIDGERVSHDLVVHFETTNCTA